VIADAASTVHFTKETQQDYEKQLAAGEIKEAVFNKRIRSLHLILKDGRHVLFIYAPHEEPTLDSQLTQKGITVSVLTPSAAKKEAAKPVKHKLRYIAAGILVVVVIVVGAVLLIDRKRKSAAE
jgi:hypothetical protein